MQITGVSESAFENLREQLVQKHQAVVTGTTQGTITGHAVAASYRYDGASQTLSVDVTHHPFYVPLSTIESQLRAALAGAQKPN